MEWEQCEERQEASSGMCGRGCSGFFPLFWSDCFAELPGNLWTGLGLCLPRHASGSGEKVTPQQETLVSRWIQCRWWKWSLDCKGLWQRGFAQSGQRSRK